MENNIEESQNEVPQELQLKEKKPSAQKLKRHDSLDVEARKLPSAHTVCYLAPFWSIMIMKGTKRPCCHDTLRFNFD